MFTKLLIANRGEIACRIIKTARRMGIQTVAVYSEADRHSLHVRLADEAWFVGPSNATQSYLNIEAILDACRASGAEAIHPGYGFLSENVHFARACLDANLVFIGPSVHAMEVMASKQFAKQLLEKTGVPLTPGYHDADQSDERLLTEATRLHFPVLIKAALGGGGKGMRAVHKSSDFFSELNSARREALACFGDDTMLLEKLILNPRHIELQLMADNHGNVVHVFERDCSIQRRHQKIIEEAPAPNLPSALLHELSDAAIAVARAIDYRGAGTVEFLVDDNAHFYFMEMNTRLQVEHPVTEMITGLDLVEWQLRIAADEPLPCAQSAIHAHGHAIECRLYAEDPAHGFVPSVGQLHRYHEPMLDGVRIDSGVAEGDFITRFYDPMFAKIIAWGVTRDQAITRMQQALAQTVVDGIKTNVPFLQAILAQPAYQQAKLNTHFLENARIEPFKPNKHRALLMAASADYLALSTKHAEPMISNTPGWQMHLASYWYQRYRMDDDLHLLKITPLTSQSFMITTGDDQSMTLHIHGTPNQLFVDDGRQCFQAGVDSIQNNIHIYTDLGLTIVSRCSYEVMTSTTPQTGNQLTAPMPSTIVALLKKPGDSVQVGDALLILEAMKMEHTIHAPFTGRLQTFFYPVGAQVNEGTLLAVIENNANEEG
jgi:3-methylcrotonyl-CoA carboxylase alpha subunit